jgi:hypothetical protein
MLKKNENAKSFFMLSSRVKFRIIKEIYHRFFNFKSFMFYFVMRNFHGNHQAEKGISGLQASRFESQFKRPILK